MSTSAVSTPAKTTPARTTPARTTLAERWREMVTVGLLGTDRRDPPAPVPGLLADLAADEPRPTPSQRLLQQVAAITVLRRAGVRPAPAASAIAPPPSDDRPITPSSSAATWRRIVADWPVLEDEWLLAVAANGWRLAPDLVAPLLARHRSDLLRRARVIVAAGPVADWLVAQQPRLAPGGRPRAPGVADAADAARAAALPELTTLPELAALLAAPAPAVVETVVGGLSSGAYGIAHRAVLTNFVARVTTPTLMSLAAGLDDVDPSRPAIGLAIALADLARTRAAMLDELQPDGAR